MDLVPVPHHQVRVRRNQVLALRLAALVPDLDTRLALLVRRVRHDPLRHARHLVHLLVQRHPLLQVVEMAASLRLGQDRERERVPLQQQLRALDLLPVRHPQLRPVHHRVALPLPALPVHHRQLAVAVHRDQRALLVGHRVHPVVPRVAVRLRRLPRLLPDPRRRPSHVERPHRQLRARLPDRLRRDDPHRLAPLDQPSRRQVPPVALLAHPALRLARQHRADLHPLDPRRLDCLRQVLRHLVVRHDHRLALVVAHLVRHHAPHDPVPQLLADLARLHQRLHVDPVARLAVRLGDDHVLRHVHQPPRQVARVGCLQGRVRQPLARPVRRDEVLQHVQALAEVRRDRRLDDLPARLRHQAPHPRQLPDLLLRAPRPRVRHHEDRIQRPARLHVREHLLRHVVGQLRPDLDDLVVALPVRDRPVQILLLDLHYLLLRLPDQPLLLARHHHVVDADRHPRHRREQEAQVLQLVQHPDRLLPPQLQVAVRHQLAQAPLLQQAVDVRHLRRQPVVQQHPAHRRLQVLPHVEHRLGLPHVLTPRDRQVDHRPAVQQTHRRLRLHCAHVVGQQNLLRRPERAPLPSRPGPVLGQVVHPQHHVLRRRRDRRAVGRRQDVVRAQHQHVRLHLRLRRQRDVHRHLVAVEVGVERRAHQRVDLDRLAFHQHRLEGLDAQPVQRGRPVEQHRVVLDHVLEDVPDDAVLLLHQLLGLLDRRAVAALLQPLVDERLEQLQGHLLRQAALVQLQVRPDHDHRAPRVVDPLAQQVLAEAPALALERVGQRLQGPVVRSAQLVPPPPVVEQRVDGLLQHALLVAHDHVRGAQVHQLAQPVVAVDDATVEVVEVRRREAPAVQLHERAQLRRDDRNRVQDHPFRLVARPVEGVDDLEATRVLEPLLDRCLGPHQTAESLGKQ